MKLNVTTEYQELDVNYDDITIESDVDLQLYFGNFSPDIVAEHIDILKNTPRSFSTKHKIFFKGTSAGTITVFPVTFKPAPAINGGGGGTDDHDLLKNKDLNTQHTSSTINTKDTTLTKIIGDNLKESLKSIDGQLGAGGGTIEHNSTTKRDISNTHPATAISVDDTGFTTLAGGDVLEILSNVDTELSKDITDNDVVTDVTPSANLTGDDQKKVNQSIDSNITKLINLIDDQQIEIDAIKGSVSSTLGFAYTSATAETGDITVDHGLNSDDLQITTHSRVLATDQWQQNSIPWVQDPTDPKNKMLFTTTATAFYKFVLSSITADTNLVTQGELTALQTKVDANTNAVGGHTTDIGTNTQAITTNAGAIATNTGAIATNAHNIATTQTHVNAINKIKTTVPAGATNTLFNSMSEDFINNTKDRYKVTGSPAPDNLIDGDSWRYTYHVRNRRDTAANRDPHGDIDNITVISFLDSNDELYMVSFAKRKSTGKTIGRFTTCYFKSDDKTWFLTNEDSGVYYWKEFDRTKITDQAYVTMVLEQNAEADFAYWSGDINTPNSQTHQALEFNVPTDPTKKYDVSEFDFYSRTTFVELDMLNIKDV